MKRKLKNNLLIFFENLLKEWESNMINKKIKDDKKI
jgi:hypothetical protein